MAPIGVFGHPARYLYSYLDWRPKSTLNSRGSKHNVVGFRRGDTLRETKAHTASFWVRKCLRSLMSARILTVGEDLK